MALKTYNPTTPGRRQLTLVDRSHLWKGKPEKALTEGLTKSGGRNNLGRLTARRRGGGHKRSLSHRRLQAAEVRRPGEGRAARIRSEPLRLHRADPLLGRRDLLHHRAAAPGGRRHGRLRRAGRREARQRHAAPRHSRRHDHSQRGAQDRPRRADRARRRLLCADRRPRPRLRDPPAEFRRAAARQRRLHGDDRRGLQSGPLERLDRQGGPQPLARLAAVGARRRHEPDRPSAWRRRGPQLAAAGIRSRRGASRPRARRPAPTRRRRNTSCARGTPARGAEAGIRRKTWRAQFGKARSSTATF